MTRLSWIRAWRQCKYDLCGMHTSQGLLNSALCSSMHAGDLSQHVCAADGTNTTLSQHPFRRLCMHCKLRAGPTDAQRSVNNTVPSGACWQARNKKVRVTENYRSCFGAGHGRVSRICTLSSPITTTRAATPAGHSTESTGEASQCMIVVPR